MRPRLPVARPVASLIATSASAASTETSAVLREGDTADTLRKRPAGAGLPKCDVVREPLRVGDVAVELLLQHRPGALALALPVAEQKRLILRGAVVEVEL